MPMNLSGPYFQTKYYGRYVTTFVTATSRQHAEHLLKELLPGYVFRYGGRTTLGEFISLDKAFHSACIPLILFRSDSGLTFQTMDEAMTFYDDEATELYEAMLEDLIDSPDPIYEDWHDGTRD